MEKREGLSFPRDLDPFYHLIVFRGVIFFQSNYLVDMCCRLFYTFWLPSKQNNNEKKKKNPLLLFFWWEIHVNNLHLRNNFSEFTLFSWEVSHRSLAMEEMATRKKQAVAKKEKGMCMPNMFPKGLNAVVQKPPSLRLSTAGGHFWGELPACRVQPSSFCTWPWNREEITVEKHS